MIKNAYVLLVLVLFSQLVCADWIQVTGKAPYKKGGYEQARENAREDALQQAIMQMGSHVKSEQKVVNGILKHDQISVSSQARVNKSLILDEYIWKGVLFLSMNVDVDEIPACTGSQASTYKKQVVVLGFSVQSPDQARLGAIHDVNRGLSSELNQALHERGSLVVFQSSQHSLYEDLINAPSSYTEQKTLTKAAAFAKQTGAQFVVSGVVRDLGFEDEAAFGTSFWSKLKRFQANTKRRFSVDVFVHDGFSGAIIWQKNFALSAKWTTDPDKKIGFGSAEFWQDNYGAAVGSLVNEMATMVDEQLRCQPFMTRISRIEGKTIHFLSGASSGVRPGDKLALYRTFNFYDAGLLKGVELTNVKTTLTVSQVHPGFASGTILVDPGRLNIQIDDLVIAW
ncbi:MAG: hypothetical protein ACI9T9_001654 [Oleiphilaceae bacterium]|jgi:hypothetical protein